MSRAHELAPLLQQADEVLVRAGSFDQARAVRSLAADAERLREAVAAADGEFNDADREHDRVAQILRAALEASG